MEISGSKAENNTQSISLLKKLYFPLGIFSFKSASILLFLLLTVKVYSQEEIITEEEIVEEIDAQGDQREFEFAGELAVEGLVSSRDELPFWMYHNRRGRVTETTNISALLSGEANYNLTFANLKIGGGILFQDGETDQFFLDELYAQFTSLRFHLTAGRKHQKELYDGLSASNRNILWSLNAPALPGIQFGTNSPIFLSGDEGIGFEGSWNAYLLERNRFVKYARVHRVNFLLVYRSENNFQIKAGIDHFAQWGGSSRERGPIDGGSNDYFEIITGQEDFGTGNHLGTYEFYLQKDRPNMYVEFFYNYLYEDNSRMGFGNFPDGRYGLFLNFTDRDRVIDKVLYEFNYTRHQSSNAAGYNQNYLNNGIYQSGWTFKERIIGSPFFTYDKEQDQIVNNKFVMHHIGISGNFSEYFKSYPYKLLVSGGRNDGTYRNRYFPNEDVLYWSYEMQLFQDFIEVGFQVAGEYNSQGSPIYGAGVRMSKQF